MLSTYRLLSPSAFSSSALDRIWVSYNSKINKIDLSKEQLPIAFSNGDFEDYDLCNVGTECLNIVFRTSDI